MTTSKYHAAIKDELTSLTPAELYAEYRKCAIMSPRMTAIADEFWIRAKKEGFPCVPENTISDIFEFFGVR